MISNLFDSITVSNIPYACIGNCSRLIANIIMSPGFYFISFSQTLQLILITSLTGSTAQHLSPNASVSVACEG